MTSRERLLAALNNERPDRLPCQVHGWMQAYLDEYLEGMDWFQAYKNFDMDYAIYVSPDYHYADQDLSNWQKEYFDLGTDNDGNHCWKQIIKTPKGELSCSGAYNRFTGWNTEHVIKCEQDFELWNEFYPIPDSADLDGIKKTRDKLGDKGIVRSHPFSPGQGSPWQSFCCMLGTEDAIFWAIDKPDFMHHVLEEILNKTLQVTELWQGTTADMVEIGGGAGSSTVISPALFEEFCLPYDQKQIHALQNVGLKVVYHLCGGLMPMLELVVKAGADGLETMTPVEMGGDCDLKKASHLVGDKLFFIGGFNQSSGFETGSPEIARQQVFDCFEATKDHAGYIIAPSDHFFKGSPENLQAFADACKECIYQ